VRSLLGTVAALAILSNGCATQTTPAERGPVGTWRTNDMPRQSTLRVQQDGRATLTSEGGSELGDFEGRWRSSPGMVVITEDPRPIGNPPPAQRVLTLRTRPDGSLETVLNSRTVIFNRVW